MFHLGHGTSSSSMILQLRMQLPDMVSLSIRWSLTILAKVPTYCKETSLFSLVSFRLRRTIKAWLLYLAMVSVTVLEMQSMLTICIFD